MEAGFFTFAFDEEKNWRKLFYVIWAGFVKNAWAYSLGQRPLDAFSYVGLLLQRQGWVLTKGTRFSFLFLAIIS